MAEIELINLLKYHDLYYTPIESMKSLIKIHALFFHRVLFDPQTATEYYYAGRYYDHFVKDYDLMKKYYLEAANLSHPSAMNNLGIYYEVVEKNHDLAEKYYLMAINLNHIPSMYNFGLYYDRKKNHEPMIKYYLMVINSHNSNNSNNSNTKLISKAMNNLGVHYDDAEDYDLSKKYFLMAIELKNPKAMYNLALYYGQVESNYELMEKYYLEASDLQYANSIEALAKHYFETKNAVKLFNFCLKYSVDNDAYMKLALGISIDPETEFVS